MLKHTFKIVGLSVLVLLIVIVTRTLLHTPEAANLPETVDYSLDEDLFVGAFIRVYSVSDYIP